MTDTIVGPRSIARLDIPLRHCPTSVVSTSGRVVALPMDAASVAATQARARAGAVSEQLEGESRGEQPWLGADGRLVGRESG